MSDPLDIDYEAMWQSANAETGRLRHTIERLESELAEMRRKLAEMHGARLTWADRALKAEQKIIDMRRTHVKVKEKCGRCGGDGTVYDRMKKRRVPCPDCIDGLVLADGVIPLGKDWYVIPAEMVEGTDDE